MLAALRSPLSVGLACHPEPGCRRRTLGNADVRPFGASSTVLPGAWAVSEPGKNDPPRLSPRLSLSTGLIAGTILASSRPDGRPAPGMGHLHRQPDPVLALRGDLPSAADAISRRRALSRRLARPAVSTVPPRGSLQQHPLRALPEARAPRSATGQARQASRREYVHRITGREPRPERPALDAHARGPRGARPVHVATDKQGSPGKAVPSLRFRVSLRGLEASSRQADSSRAQGRGSRPSQTRTSPASSIKLATAARSAAGSRSGSGTSGCCPPSRVAVMAPSVGRPAPHERVRADSSPPRPPRT